MGSPAVYMYRGRDRIGAIVHRLYRGQHKRPVLIGRDGDHLLIGGDVTQPVVADVRSGSPHAIPRTKPPSALREKSRSSSSSPQHDDVLQKDGCPNSTRTTRARWAGPSTHLAPVGASGKDVRDLLYRQVIHRLSGWTITAIASGPQQTDRFDPNARRGELDLGHFTGGVGDIYRGSMAAMRVRPTAGHRDAHVGMGGSIGLDPGQNQIQCGRPSPCSWMGALRSAGWSVSGSCDGRAQPDSRIVTTRNSATAHRFASLCR